MTVQSVLSPEQESTLRAITEARKQAEIDRLDLIFAEFIGLARCLEAGGLPEGDSAAEILEASRELFPGVEPLVKLGEYSGKLRSLKTIQEEEERAASVAKQALKADKQLQKIEEEEERRRRAFEEEAAPLRLIVRTNSELQSASVIRESRRREALLQLLPPYQREELDQLDARRRDLHKQREELLQVVEPHTFGSAFSDLEGFTLQLKQIEKDQARGVEVHPSTIANLEGRIREAEQRLAYAKGQLEKLEVLSAELHNQREAILKALLDD